MDLRWTKEPAGYTTKRKKLTSTTSGLDLHDVQSLTILRCLVEITFKAIFSYRKRYLRHNLAISR